MALVGDSAYAAKGMRGMSGTITLTTRPRANAALHAPKPERTGKAGRPTEKGERLPSLGQIANDPARADEWASHEVLRYGKRQRVEALVMDCLWYSVFGGRAPGAGSLVPDEAHPLGRRHAGQAQAHDHRRPISANTAPGAIIGGNPGRRSGVGRRRSVDGESRVTKL